MVARRCCWIGVLFSTQGRELECDASNSPLILRYIDHYGTIKRPSTPAYHPSASNGDCKRLYLFTRTRIERFWDVLHIWAKSSGEHGTFVRSYHRGITHSFSMGCPCRNHPWSCSFPCVFVDGILADFRSICCAALASWTFPVGAPLFGMAGKSHFQCSNRRDARNQQRCE
jgi:hypothetical protein